jgi:hypothetical protein
MKKLLVLHGANLNIFEPGERCEPHFHPGSATPSLRIELKTRRRRGVWTSILYLSNAPATIVFSISLVPSYISSILASR